MPADPITLVRWRDAKTDPPDGSHDLMWTDVGEGYFYREKGMWYSEGYDMYPQPSVWCDPVPPGDDPLTTDDLIDLAADRMDEYIDTVEAQVERLRKALQAMFNCYEGVYDMTAPFLHRSADAERADALARAALAGEGDEV